MALSNNQKRRALINMDGFGGTGPYPPPDGDLSPIRDLRHLAGLYPFEGESIADFVGLADDGDIFIGFDPSEGGEMFIEGGDLKRDKGLKTAVLISLLTDRIAEETDVLPDNSGDRRGFWKDPKMGSRLWLLFRAALTPDVPSKIEDYTKEALSWMIEQKVAGDVIVRAQRTDVSLVEWTVQIIKPGAKDNSNFRFFFNWENEIFGEVS